MTHKKSNIACSWVYKHFYKGKPHTLFQVHYSITNSIFYFSANILHIFSFFSANIMHLKEMIFLTGHIQPFDPMVLEKWPLIQAHGLEDFAM